MTGSVPSFTPSCVHEAIESLPAAESESEIHSRYAWITRAIEVEYVADCGQVELAEQMREFYAGRYAEAIGPLLQQIEDAREAEAEEQYRKAWRLNEIADVPRYAEMFARELGRDRSVNARVKGVTTRTGRTR